MYEGQSTVLLPVGTVDILNCNLRSTTRLTGTGTSTTGVAANAFDGNIETVCTVNDINGNVTLTFPSTTVPTTFGILPSIGGSWSVLLQTSSDGVVWTTRYTNTALTLTNDQWFWLDLEGIPSSTIAVRLRSVGTTILSLREFYVGNNPLEVPLAIVNRDSYSNLPNKTFRGRPTEFWYDKRQRIPVLNLWPAPQAEYTFWQLVNYAQRQVQDVGTLTQELEIPQRWYMAIINELAKELSLEIPEVPVELRGELLPLAEKTMHEAWSSENDGSPTYVRPNIRPYTA